MDYLNLLGRPLEDVLEHLCSGGSQFMVSYTWDPRNPGDESMEKRVIRIKEKDEVLHILVGYFQKPCCKPRDTTGAL